MKKSGLHEEQIKELLEKRLLWDYILDDLGTKHVGDIPAKEIVFLSTIGRLVKNKKPYSFNLILHSSSSAGKDHLVESVLMLFPKEDIEAFGIRNRILGAVSSIITTSEHLKPTVICLPSVTFPV